MGIPWIALKFGWRRAFVFSGALGLFWRLLWLLIYPRGRSTIGPSSGSSLDLRNLKSLLPLLKRWETGGIVVGRSLTDPIWWF